MDVMTPVSPEQAKKLRWALSVMEASRPSAVCVDYSKGRQRLVWSRRRGRLISVEMPPLD